jgi:fibronectin type 3 domain-containing protein
MDTHLIRRTVSALLPAGVTAALCLISAPPASADVSGFSSVLTRAPYLSDLTQTSVQVSWATNAQYQGVVQFGPPGNCTANSVIATKMGSPITIGATTEWTNSVLVTGLSPATTYCYRITNTGATPVDLLGSNPSPQFTTLQLPNGSQPLTFDVLGDWGDTTNGAVNDGSLNVNQAGVDAQIAASGAQFALSVGDVAYPGGTQTEYGDLTQSGANISAVFGPSFWAVPGQTIPLLQVDGNHGQNVTSITNWPEQVSAASSSGGYSMVSYPSSVDGITPGSFPTTNYAFSTGGVRFYMLDAAWGNSNTGTATGGACGANCAIYQVDHDAHWTPTSAEYQWLTQDLAAHSGGLKLAFFHFPLYTDNATQTTDAYLDNTPGSTGSLEQLLHDNGVRLAFTGHAHIYERNIATPGGVTSYVTGGGGGQAEPVSHCSATDAYALGWSYGSSAGSACGAAARPTSDGQVYHFLKVTVNGSAVTVTPVNSQGQSFDAQTYNFAADSTAPSAPGSLAYTQLASGQDQLTWTAATDNTGVTAYDIYRNGIFLATVDPTVTSYTDSTVATGVRNTYRVAARDLAGNTTMASVTTGGKNITTAPTAPSKLTASLATSPLGYTQASLSWSASSDKFAGVSYYTILRNGTAVARVPATSISYGDTGLTPGASYTYKVTATNSVGNVSQPSNTATITTQADSSPTAPGTPTAVSVSSSQAWLSWPASTDSVGISRYDVIRNGSVIASVSGTSYIDATVAPSSSYTYQVIADNAAGMTAASGTLNVITPAQGTLFSDGFETGDLSQWTTVNGLAVETSNPHSGATGAEELSPNPSTGLSGPTYATESLPGAYTELWAQAWVYVTSRTSSVQLIGFQRSSGAPILTLSISQTGKLSLRNSPGAQTLTSTTVMPTGSWHRVVLHALVNGTSSSFDVSLDGTQVPDLSLTGQNLGTGPIATLQLGDTSGGTYDIDFDDIAVSQSSI